MDDVCYCCCGLEVGVDGCGGGYGCGFDEYGGDDDVDYWFWNGGGGVVDCFVEGWGGDVGGGGDCFGDVVYGVDVGVGGGVFGFVWGDGSC